VIVRTGCEKRPKARSVGKNGLVAQDTIKVERLMQSWRRRAACCRGSVEHILHVMADDRIEAEVVGPAGGLRLRLNLLAGGRARSSARMTPLTASSNAVSSTEANSRTFPGQLCCKSRPARRAPASRAAAGSGYRCGRAESGRAGRCLRGAGAGEEWRSGRPKAGRPGRAEGVPGQPSGAAGLRGGKHHGAARGRSWSP